MTGVGIALALFAALMTAAAHFVWKAAGDRMVVRAVISASCAVMISPALFWVGLPGREIWPWLTLSGATHIPYQLAVCRAYDRLDFSLAFPIARGVVPVATAVLGVVFLEDHLEPLAFLGIGLVSGGLLVLALSKAIPRSGLIAALTAGVLTTLYTLVDAKGVRIASNAVEFIVWLFIIEAVLITSLALVLRRDVFLSNLRTVWRGGLMGGLYTLLGYGAILLAYRYIPVGVGSALRETSTLFVALFAAFGLGEVLRWRRKLGIALGLGGAVTVAFASLA